MHSSQAHMEHSPKLSTFWCIHSPCSWGAIFDSSTEIPHMEVRPLPIVSHMKLQWVLWITWSAGSLTALHNQGLGHTIHTLGCVSWQAQLTMPSLKGTYAGVGRLKYAGLSSGHVGEGSGQLTMTFTFCSSWSRKKGTQTI